MLYSTRQLKEIERDLYMVELRIKRNLCIFGAVCIFILCGIAEAIL